MQTSASPPDWSSQATKGSWQSSAAQSQSASPSHASGIGTHSKVDSNAWFSTQTSSLPQAAAPPTVAPVLELPLESEPLDPDPLLSPVESVSDPLDALDSPEPDPVDAVSVSDVDIVADVDSVVDIDALIVPVVSAPVVPLPVSSVPLPSSPHAPDTNAKRSKALEPKNAGFMTAQV